MATLLPCPIAFRSGASDPSEPLVTMASDEGRMRIGLAHGGVTDFTDTGEAIAPDRDRARGSITSRWATGTGGWPCRTGCSIPAAPEQDRFKHGRRGVCLCVGLDGPGATPRGGRDRDRRIPLAEVELPLHPRQDAAAALDGILPPSGRRDILMRVAATGWAGLPDRADLDRAADVSRPNSPISSW